MHTLRQQLDKSSGKPHYALADFLSDDHSVADYLGGFVVGIHGADEWAQELEEKEHDPYQAIMVKALADRCAEAFAELLHHRARVAWGIENPTQFSNEELIKENYQGIRPAPGYPAQPDHTEKPLLFELLGASEATGVTLTESQARAAIEDGTIVGGMIPKIEEALKNLARGVKAIHILGTQPGSLRAEADAPGSSGTALLPG